MHKKHFTTFPEGGGGKCPLLPMLAGAPLRRCHSCVHVLLTYLLTLRVVVRLQVRWVRLRWVWLVCRGLRTLRARSLRRHLHPWVHHRSVNSTSYLDLSRILPPGLVRLTSVLPRRWLYVCMFSDVFITSCTSHCTPSCTIITTAVPEEDGAEGRTPPPLQLFWISRQFLKFKSL